MNISRIEENVQQLLKDFSADSFIYDLLTAYGKPKASITRLQKGNLNLSKLPGEIIWKKNLLFRAVIDRVQLDHNKHPGLVREAASNVFDLHTVADQLRKSEDVIKHGLRFVIVTDYETLLAVDTKTADTLDIPIKDLPKHFDFFLPWSGQEKHKAHNESQADLKAAGRMGKLYEQISKDNPGMDAAGRHSLNVFLCRLLFCYFAEDTEIFPTRGMFTTAIKSHTQDDGSDLNTYLDRLFEAMNKKDRSAYPAFIQAFPYVNGGLFEDRLNAPAFSRQSRAIIVECGGLDWSEINPDIFGSMMQAVVHKDERAETGMHYTSVSNIMKVIEPLFLRELRETFEENYDNTKGLEKLRARLSTIQVFDPACGSGNFLIIAFKELRKLEMEIFQRLRKLDINYQTLFTMPQIKLVQFFGIELDDFAHEIAILSLWLAEHQMNVKFKETLGIGVPALPLQASGHIVCGNATRLDWLEVCPRDEKSEVFVLGNPPYSGARKQDEQQKQDMKLVFEAREEYKDSDYVACWLLKASSYIRGANASFAFVVTSSVSQGEQVAYIWPTILSSGLEIGFAYQCFKWTNSAKNNAGVTCVIVGVRNISPREKLLFSGELVKGVSNITPYLSSGKTTFVHRTEKPLAHLPAMVTGNMARDGGHLILSREEKEALIGQYPEAIPFLRRLYGSEEFINGKERWCLWITDEHVDEAKQIGPIRERIAKVYNFRISSKAHTTNTYSSIPHKFAQRCHKETNAVIIPEVSSERREYVPIGFLHPGTVITNKLFAIYDAEPYIFSLLSSKLHNVWIRAVAGRLEERISYSSVICYNTFPIPELTDRQKETLSTHIFNVLSEREKHSEKTIAQLYDPDKMPAELVQAHRDLDAAVERCYRSKPFSKDEERLDFLFGLYEETLLRQERSASAKV